jgi:hypothetical protein
MSGSPHSQQSPRYDHYTSQESSPAGHSPTKRSRSSGDFTQQQFETEHPRSWSTFDQRGLTYPERQPSVYQPAFSEALSPTTSAPYSGYGSLAHQSSGGKWPSVMQSSPMSVPQVSFTFRPPPHTTDPFALDPLVCPTTTQAHDPLVPPATTQTLHPLLPPATTQAHIPLGSRATTQAYTPFVSTTSTQAYAPFVSTTSTQAYVPLVSTTTTQVLDLSVSPTTTQAPQHEEYPQHDWIPPLLDGGHGSEDSLEE